MFLMILPSLTYPGLHTQPSVHVVMLHVVAAKSYMFSQVIGQSVTQVLYSSLGGQMFVVPAM